MAAEAKRAERSAVDEQIARYRMLAEEFSKRMEVLVTEIKARYPDRFVVLDVPSVQQSTEARILAQYCDLALLVVPFGKVVTDEVLSAIDAIGKEHFAGLVFNN